MLENTTKIFKKIGDTVSKHNMLNYGDRVVVGVSGGADSMLLLKYLLSVRDDMSLDIIVANVEHGIRGQESIDDSAFVESFCKAHNVAFSQLSINAVEEAKQKKMTVEEYSRMCRYDFFRTFNADKVATAHNLSDNVETVLFRLSRGTSIRGCCGIPAVRGSVIRPLIECTSEEIRQACSDIGLDYRIDSTNLDSVYTRNYIRNEIIPRFKELNPSFDSAISRFINSVNDDEAFIQSEVNKCFDACFKNNTLSLDKLNKFHPSIIKRTIILYVSLYEITLDDLHLNGVYALTKKPGRYQIMSNYFAISDKHRLRIAIFEETLDFDDVIIKKQITSREQFLINCEQLRKNFDFYCDYDKIIGEITIRSRDAGDEIAPVGRGVTKSLKKLYNEYHINVEDRENIPVICDEKGVIGVYGYCYDERVKIDNNTQSVILLNISTED